MIRLALVRHAKSDWGDEALRDHDRPLSERGLRDAPRMAAGLAATGFRPDVLLSSTALRARTTAEEFARALGTEVTLDEELYGASAGTLLDAAAAAGVDAVMIVAHDPGMSVLAESLSGARITHMPTCAVATFAWDVDEWAVVDSVDPVDWTWETPR